MKLEQWWLTNLGCPDLVAQTDPLSFQRSTLCPSGGKQTNKQNHHQQQKHQKTKMKKAEHSSSSTALFTGQRMENWELNPQIDFST